MATGAAQPVPVQLDPTPIQGSSIPVSSVVAAAAQAIPIQPSQISVSGSPESAPAQPAQQESVKAPEYGFEEAKRIEQAVENANRPEIKEPKPPVAQQQQVVTDNKITEPQKDVTPSKPVLSLPKYLGHKVPEELTNDLESVGSKKGTGDPNLARTAIYFFLDRMLKRRASQLAK